MRLSDLNPLFYAEAGRAGQGLTFDCPGACCAGLPSAIGIKPGMGETKKRAGISFRNPLDGKAPLAGKTWTRIGCLSKDMTVVQLIEIMPGHWSGYLREGELVPA